MDEPDLQILFRSDEPAAALGQLFERHADRIYRLSLSLLADEQEAEDVVQQTFLNALTNRERFEGGSNVGSWLFRIAYNASHDRLRRRPEYSLPEEDAASKDDEAMPMPHTLTEWRWTPEAVLRDQEAQTVIQEAIKKLPEKLRSVFHLRDVEECSIEETSEILGISRSAVKVRLHRARLALRETLSVYFSEWREQRS